MMRRSPFLCRASDDNLAVQIGHQWLKNCCKNKSRLENWMRTIWMACWIVEYGNVVGNTEEENKRYEIVCWVGKRVGVRREQANGKQLHISIENMYNQSIIGRLKRLVW